jgi:RNA polymerase sigma-70 factor (ECF subfamily)
VVALNRAVALSRTRGAAAALAAIAPLESEPLLNGYYLLPSVKARFLTEIGDRPGAAAAYREALARPCTEPERRFLIRRLGALAGAHG